VIDLTSYSLSDFVLFSAETYFRQFQLHNQDVWPSQTLSVGFALAVLWRLVRYRHTNARLVAAGLATCWLWVAWTFHLERYADINWAAPWFGWAFFAQAVLLLVNGGLLRRFEPRVDTRGSTRLGLALFALAVTAYPLIAPLTGRPWTGAELFGAAPAPTAIATLGLLLCTTGRTPWELVPIPFAWCVLTALLGWGLDALVLLVPGALACIALAAMLTRRTRAD